MSKDRGNTKHPIPVQKIKAETEKAWLIQFDDGREHWLPKSQCWVQIMIPEWLIEQKGLKPMQVANPAPEPKHEQSMYELDDSDDRPF